MDLLQQINNHTYLGTLKLPALALGSAKIQDVIERFFVDSQLIINKAVINASIDNSIVTVTGTSMFMALDNLSVVATFQSVSSDTVLTFKAELPANWTFSTCFNSLAGSFFDKLNLSDSSLVVSSDNQSETHALFAGLNYKGTINGGLPDPLSLLISPPVSLIGTIDFVNGMPSINLPLSAPISLRLGSLALPSLDFTFTALPQQIQTNDETKWIYINQIRYNTSFSLDSKTIPLSGTYSLITEHLILSVLDLSQSLENGINEIYTLLDYQQAIDWPVQLPADIFLDRIELIGCIKDTPSLEYISFGFGMDTSWQLISNYVRLDTVWLTVWFDNPFDQLNRSYGGQVYGHFDLGPKSNVKLDIYATIPSTADHDGWIFGGYTQPGSILDIRNILSDLGNKFGIALPSILERFTLRDLYLSFNTKHSDINWSMTVDFEVGETPIEIVFSLALVHNGDSYTKTIDGQLLLSGYVFNITLSEDSGVANESGGSDTMSFTAQCNAEYPLDFSDIATAFGFQLPSIPEDLDLSLSNVSFSCDFEKHVLLLTADSHNPNYGKAVFVAHKENDANSAYHYCFLLKVDKAFKLSDLPLLGADLAQVEPISFGPFTLCMSSADTITSSMAKTINDLIIQVDNSQGSYPSLPSSGMPGSCYLSGSATFGTQELPLLIGISSNKDGDGAQLPSTPASAANAAPLTQTSTSDGTNWFALQKNFGPVSMKKIGVRFDSSSQILWFEIEASLAMGPLTLTFEGLGIGSSINTFEPEFSLHGIGIDWTRPPIKVDGFFINMHPATGYEYSGGVTVGGDGFQLQSIGFYGQQQDVPSMFIFGDIAHDFGGPPAFFITGVALGLGYNSCLRIPNIDQVGSFPLVQVLPTSMIPETNALGGDSKPQDVLNTLMNTQPPWISQRQGSLWFAAGITFTSFELVNSQALIMVEFDQELIISLVGTSRAQFPKSAGVGGPIYAYIELDLEVEFAPQQGLFSVQAVLANSSFLLDKACVLQGGFAFFVWYGPNPHAGDFVLTLGGYNPGYLVPSHYPKIPEVGFHWSIDSSISISGGAYFAFTPSTLMVGGELNATYQAGNLKAWFAVHADIIVQWSPFWFDASFGVTVGASYKVDLWFTSFTITVELGCSLEIWGPPTGGVIGIDWYIISFTIPFGVSRNSSKPVLNQWSQVQAMLPNSGTADAPNVVSLKPVSGLTAKSTNTSTPASADQAPWLVRASQFSFNTSSSVPANSAKVGLTHTILGDTFNVAPLGWRNVEADHVVSIVDSGNDDVSSSFIVSAVFANVPSQLWGEQSTQTPDSSTQLVADQLVGLLVSVNPPQIGSSAGAVNVSVSLGTINLHIEKAHIGVSATAAAAGDLALNNQNTLNVIDDANTGIASAQTSNKRAAIFTALRTLQLANTIKNDPLTNFASQAAGGFFADIPLLVA